MNKIILLGFLIINCHTIHSQINAITETGDQVILYENGSWNYLNKIETPAEELTLNPLNFELDSKASFLVKSSKLNVGIYINPKVWSFNKAEEHDAAEFEFQNKDNDLYAILIAEKIQIPIETLRDIAFQNAQKASADIRIIKEEYRIVNDVKVLMMQMTGTVQGLMFSYFGYYYSNENGSVQLLTYTSDNLFKKHEGELEKFVNGMVIL